MLSLIKKYETQLAYSKKFFRTNYDVMPLRSKMLHMGKRIQLRLIIADLKELEKQNRINHELNETSNQI